MNGEPKDYGQSGMVPGVTFARIDYAGYGGTAGKLGGDCANKDFGGKGQALIIQQKEGAPGKQLMDEAMEKELKAAAPGVEIVGRIIVESRADGLTKVGQVLQAHPGLNVVVSNHDEGALGAMSAFEGAGNKSHCFVASGGNDEVLKSVDAGALYGVAGLDFGGDMMQTFDAIATMLKDPKAAGRQLSVPMNVRTRK